MRQFLRLGNVNASTLHLLHSVPAMTSWMVTSSTVAPSTPHLTRSTQALAPCQRRSSLAPSAHPTCRRGVGRYAPGVLCSPHLNSHRRAPFSCLQHMHEIHPEMYSVRESSIETCPSRAIIGSAHLTNGCPARELIPRDGALFPCLLSTVFHFFELLPRQGDGIGNERSHRC